MEKPINICVITTVSLTLRAFLLEQLVYLSQNGFRVTVICDFDENLLHECPTELNYIPVPMTRDSKILSTLRSFWYLYRVIRNNNYDIVQYATPKASLLASFVAFLNRVPVRLYCQWGIRYVGLSGLSRRFFKTLEKVTCFLSTDIVPDSFGNLEFAVEERLYPRGKGRVVHRGSANGVNLSKFNIKRKSEWRSKIRKELDIPEEAFVYGFVGRITRDKGIRELIAAFLSIYEQNSYVYLLLVGPQEEEHGLDNHVINIIFSHPNIRVVGFRRNTEEYISVCDLMVLPSYREGFGIVAIEGQAMGVPVITTDIPGPREAIISGTTGILIPPGDIDKLKHVMYILMTNNSLLKSMGQQGFQYVRENFEQDILWQKILEDRRELLKKNKGDN